ncbi:MAG TPA: DNA-3-methyladenine glycosylase I, partial [Acidimicrobiales bacterium]|nr:DNA-3-methyladenine glycosylase I [Acidimicrobiales bacterium]
MSKDPVSRISSGASAPSVERCAWATGPLLTPYHDEEWGVPAHDDRTQFEFLVLEAAQAGLSWLTVLRKRDGYRQAFGGFDASRVAEYGEREIEALMEDQGIIRNRQKITAAVGNAQALLRVAEEHGSFSQYLWEFAGG